MGNSLTWTMGRQLASFGDISYTYNEDGIRTSKTSNGITTKFYLNGTNIIEQTDGTTTLYFFYDSNGEVIGFRYDGNDYFYVKNVMGDIIAITDSNKNIVAEYLYDPWGKVLDEENLTAIGNLNPFRYRSYYYDSDIEMYYLQSRYYDLEIGRFISCDDVNYIGVTESEVSYNPFTYCGNNPMNYSDPSGYAVNVSGYVNIWYIQKYFIGINQSNEYIYLFMAYIQTTLNNLIEGVNLHSAILAVTANNVKITVCYEKSTNAKGIEKNKKYILGFVKDNYVDDLAEYVLEAYKKTYKKDYKGRTKKGVELEIYLHMYMYYFDIDKDLDYRSSKVFDIDNNGNGLFFEKRLVGIATSSLINMSKNAIKKGKSNYIISVALKKYLK